MFKTIICSFIKIIRSKFLLLIKIVFHILISILYENKCENNFIIILFSLIDFGEN